MKFNITRKFSVPLAPEQCLDFMEEQINNNPSFDFRPFSFYSPFRFRRDTKFSKYFKDREYFVLMPGFFFRLFYISGHVEFDENNSVVYCEMMPPIWFFPILTCIFALILILVSIEEGLFLLLGGSLGMFVYAPTALRIFAELEKVLESAQHKQNT